MRNKYPNAVGQAIATVCGSMIPGQGKTEYEPANSPSDKAANFGMSNIRCEDKTEWAGGIMMPGAISNKDSSGNTRTPRYWEQVSDKIKVNSVKKQTRADLRKHYKHEVSNARRMGVRFLKVGIHTIAYSVDKDVITFATTIKSPKDPANDLYGRFIAAMRYMNGAMAFVRKPKDYAFASDFLHQMFYRTEW